MIAVKKLITIAMGMSLMFGTSAAMAAEKAAPAKKASYSRQYGMAGCGLGSVVMGKKGGQIFAATTNSTFYNQMFGISLNTLNCVDSPNKEVAQRMDQYVAANKLALAGDMARGNGEVLSTLSTMMDCTDSAAISAAMQRNFGQIFPDTSVAPNEITDSIITVIQGDESLAAGCKRVS